MTEIALTQPAGPVPDSFPSVLGAKSTCHVDAAPARRTNEGRPLAAGWRLHRNFSSFFSSLFFRFSIFYPATIADFNLPILQFPAATQSGDPQLDSLWHARSMTTEQLTQLSESLADSVAAAAPSVVQVHGAGRPASGLVFAPDIVITTMRALGREDGLQVRGHDGSTLEAQLAGWDPTTSLALLRVAGLAGAPITPATAQPRVGHLALAVGRSWSNALSASAGIVAVIGGPLRTGRRRAIDQVLRTTAPMHDGFAGGALVDTTGALLGVITSTRIRGTTVVIPASIAWKTASSVLEHGGLKRGYLGIAGQPVRLPANLPRPAGLPDRSLGGGGSARRRRHAGESGGGRRSSRGRHHSGAGCEPD